MADGIDRNRWNHTSHIMAIIANTARNPKKKPQPWQPLDFNPYSKKPAVAKGEIDDLRDTFVDRPVNPGNSKRKAFRRKQK